MSVIDIQLPMQKNQVHCLFGTIKFMFPKYLFIEAYIVVNNFFEELGIKG